MHAETSTTVEARRTPIWSDWQWYTLLLLALVIRGVWGFVNIEALVDDPDSYRRLAQNVIDLQSFTLSHRAEPTAFRPPLYPLLLALASYSRSVQPWEVALLHVFFGTLTVGLTFVWAKAIGLNRWRLLAGLLVVCDPILLNQATLVMTETLAALLTMITLVALTTLTGKDGKADEQLTLQDVSVRSINIAGAAMLAFYCRPSFLVWVALLPLAMVALTHGWSRRIAAVIGYSLTVVFLLIPWVARNYMVFETPVIATTHGGYTLLWGNNPEYYAYLKQPDAPVWDSELFHARFNFDHPHDGTSISELERDLAAREEALANMQREPGMAAYSGLVRLSMFWRPLPHALSAEESTTRTAARWMVGAWYGLIFLLALIGLAALGRRNFSGPWLAAWLLIIALTGVHFFYWSNMRMRAPLVPILAVLACAGLQAMWPNRSKATSPDGASDS